MSYDFYITPDEYAEAATYGVDAHNLERRIRSLGWKKDKAIRTPLLKLNDRKKWTRIAEKNGIGYQTFMSRVNIRGWSVERAATEPIITKSQQAQEMNKNRKKDIPTEIVELAAENGIAYHTLRMRIKKGMDPVDAATRKLMTRKEVGQLGAKRHDEKHGRFEVVRNI